MTLGKKIENDLLEIVHEPSQSKRLALMFQFTSKHILENGSSLAFSKESLDKGRPDLQAEAKHYLYAKMVDMFKDNNVGELTAEKDFQQGVVHRLKILVLR